MDISLFLQPEDCSIFHYSNSRIFGMVDPMELTKKPFERESNLLIDVCIFSLVYILSIQLMQNNYKCSIFSKFQFIILCHISKTVCPRELTKKPLERA